MAAITLPNVQLNSTTWTQISAATVQSIQLREGTAWVVFSDTAPTSSPKDIGHKLDMSCERWLTNATGGTSWGIANSSSGAVLAVTEG